MIFPASLDADHTVSVIPLFNSEYMVTFRVAAANGCTFVWENQSLMQIKMIKSFSVVTAADEMATFWVGLYPDNVMVHMHSLSYNWGLKKSVENTVYDNFVVPVGQIIDVNLDCFAGQQGWILMHVKDYYVSGQDIQGNVEPSLCDLVGSVFS